MRIVAVCPNWIGDAVMATPALAAARNAPGVEHLTVMCRPYVAPVFEAAPYINAILTWDGPGGLTLGQAARRLRQERFDTALLLTNSFRSALLVWLGGVGERVGYSRDWRGPLLSRRLHARRSHGKFVPMPMLEYYYQLVRHLGVEEMPRQMKLYTTPADETAADDLLRRLGLASQGFMVLAPGAAFGASKCWSASRFAEVAREAQARHNLPSLLLCSPKERPVAAQIAAESAGAAILPDEALPLTTVKAVVGRARAMVTNDSGLRHFAAACNVPVVTIFGPTHIAWTEIWFDREKQLQAPVDCGPCQQKVCPQGHLKCMEAITAGQVLGALEELI